MKNLFYKELKLSIHPLCIVFSLVFSLMGLIPSYPPTIAFIYTLAAYSFLFLGANKATTTNDLFYTLNLPLRRKEVVKARLISISFLHALTLIPLLFFLFIRYKFITPNIVSDGGETLLSIDVNQLFVFIGIIGVGFSITDLIYIPWFYKTGKSIIGPTLVGVIVGAIFFAAVPIIPAYVPGLLDVLTIGSPNANYFIQIAIFVIGVGIYVGSRFLINKLATRNLEKLDY